MRTILFSLVFLIFNSALQSQSWQKDSCGSFVLRIKINRALSDTIALQFNDCKTSYAPDGVKLLSNGTCLVSGYVNRATEAILFADIKDNLLDGPKVLRFIIQPGKQEIQFTMDKGAVSSVVSDGATAEAEKIAWDKSVSYIEEREDSLLIAVRQLYKKLDSKPGDSVAINKQVDDFYGRVSKGRDSKRWIAMEYAFQHPQSQFSGYLLDHYKKKIPFDSAIILFNRLSVEVRKSDFAKSFIEELTKLSSDTAFLHTYLTASQYQKFLTTSSVYDFSLGRPDGSLLNISRFKGKYILFDTWASWCGFCHTNVLPMKKLIMKYKNKNIVFIAVSTDDKRSNWQASAKKYGYPGINVWDKEKQFSMFFKVTALPRFILVDPAGNIINEDAPPPLDGMLDKYLKSIF